MIFEEVSQLIEEVLKEEYCFSLKDLAINGHDLIGLGMQGQEIGRALHKCLNAVLEEQVPNERSALLSYVQSR